METSERTTTTRYAGRHRIVDHTAPSLPGYDVVEPIGEGGTGTVWSAVAPDGSTVAIKVVPAVDADDALVELAVLGRIRDPHLVRLHEATTLPSGDVALVLDHLAGGTVGTVVRTRGHLAPGELVTLLSPVSSTVARLHGLGVVHGDLSPDNVLLDLDGRPFVADLGVARIAGADPAGLRGTEGFVAPEVLAGAVPSAASDVHSLGALAWFCLTGEAPGPAVVRGRLAEHVDGLPDELVETVELALRTRPEERPDADALAVAIFESAPPEPVVLARGSDEVGLLTRRIRAAARPAVVGAGVVGATPHRIAVVARTLLPWVAVAAVVTVVVLGALAWTGSRDDARATTTAGTTAATTPRAPGPDGPGASPDARRSRGGADPRSLVDAPQRDPTALVQALADARSVAWSAGVAARLVEVDAPRSPALARDTEVLAAVQRARQRYVGLAFTVRDAEVVARRGVIVTIRTRIDTGAHVVRGPAGEVARPPAAGAPVLLDVVHTDSGWRVHDVREA
ncbi:hypothetical protein GCM10022415_28800 [Knoellia locipacati]|uniref:non-specific serine/threonine protein kinase n=1 Tax=Knoellia locipacati TaxID=882824 RepID=A0A512T4G3_9MICO|nr:serine/threonine-protein kinase [Knoellia locipacati]GEQ15118.1 hypothetical protein KLO01_31650 [Knoellia locipacati]